MEARCLLGCQHVGHRRRKRQAGYSSLVQTTLRAPTSRNVEGREARLLQIARSLANLKSSIQFIGVCVAPVASRLPSVARDPLSDVRRHLRTAIFVAS